MTGRQTKEGDRQKRETNKSGKQTYDGDWHIQGTDRKEYKEKGRQIK